MANELQHGFVYAMARRIATGSPSLDDLAHDELAQVARDVVRHRLTRELDRKAVVAAIDYQAERETWLGLAKSPHTARAYRTALDRLDEYARYIGKDALTLSPADVDDWTHSLTLEGYSPASVRRNTAAASSFYTWLERRHADLRNPLRGSRARPAKKATRPTAVPSAKEAQAILAMLKDSAPDLYACAAVMMHRGLRVGALPSLTLKGDKWTATTKGKEQSGTMPDSALQAIDFAKLDKKAPFAGMTAQAIADRIRYLVQGLVKAGTIDARYSVHDFRHYYAIQEYTATPDIYRLKLLLGHASIAVTESYLKSLNFSI
jgi:site-specific recombinase XerD